MQSTSSNPELFQPLEKRQLLSASINAGILQVNGTNQPDAITIDINSTTTTVKFQNSTQTFNTADYTEVVVHAGDGADTVQLTSSSGGQALVFGEGGNDTLIAGDEDDTLLGGDGDDVIYFNGTDSVNGQNGNDQILFGLPPTTPPGTPATLSAGILRIMGTDSDDQIIVRRKAVDPSQLQVVRSGAIEEFALSDVQLVQIDARGGNDDVRLINIPINSKLYGGTGDDTLMSSFGNDRIYGGDGNDWISGGDGNDILYGEAGNDRIFGGTGRDYIDGGSGADVLRGEAGIDHIFVNPAQDNAKGNSGDLITLVSI